MIKNDLWIERKATELGMIEPFCRELVREKDGKKVLSYGLSSYGYDARCGYKFKIFRRPSDKLYPIDPLNFLHGMFCEDFEGEVCIVPPNSLVLCNTVEYFRIPSNCHCYVLGKSTYARSGLHCLTTPLEAGWKGQITIEMANVTPYPIKLYAGQGVCQVCFHESDERCRYSYADRNGKYQGQTGITFSKG